MRRFSSIAALVVAFAALAGCQADHAEPASDDSDFSSDQATLLEFEFDGSLVTAHEGWTDEQTISDQMLYTVGHLNEQRSVGRLDNLVLTNIVRTEEGGNVRLTYHAKLPVAWGSKTNLPTSYRFTLPKDVSYAGQERFTKSYGRACIDRAGHDVEAGNMWYYYRPEAAGCTLQADDVVTVNATVAPSSLNTTGKYPEYHKVWEDDALEVVSIFGKYEQDGDSGDSGVLAFNRFVALMRADFGPAAVVSPGALPAAPGPAVKDVTLETKLADGKRVKVTALLVDSITATWEGFQERYESLTPTADLIAYNGHAGLGENVRALATMGRWNSSQYQIFFMNGCDTFAYVDGSLAQTRASLNGDDPVGTKYMEFVTNAMPSKFQSMAEATRALVTGLASVELPKTYDEIFTGIDRYEVVLVTGEEDNVFRPGMKLGR